MRPAQNFYCFSFNRLKIRPQRTPAETIFVSNRGFLLFLYSQPNNITVAKKSTHTIMPNQSACFSYHDVYRMLSDANALISANNNRMARATRIIIPIVFITLKVYLL